MFFLGIISIFQILFFPGLIVVNQLGFKSRLVAKTVIIIALSLVINYCLVFFLTALHLYSRVTILLIILCEIIVILFQNREKLNKPIEFWLNEFQKGLNKFLSNLKKLSEVKKGTPSFDFFLKTSYICFCLFLAYIALNWSWKLFVWNIGSIFNSYDTIRMWARWAIEWSNNTFPTSTWHYPQLLSTNWSISFTVIGNSSIQFFAQAIMPIFTLLIILMIIDLGFYKKNPGFFLGAVITYLVYKKFLGSFLIEGLGDLPCAFLAFSAVYLLFIFLDDEQPFQQKSIYGYFILICAAGSAITKQVGLLFFFLFLILFSHFYLKPLLKTDRKTKIRGLTICFLLIILIILPWYSYKQILIWKGLEKSEVSMIINATQFAYDYGGIKSQMVEIYKLLGKYFYLLLLIIPMSFFIEPITMLINIFLIFPLFISWGMFASYDFRNLSIALPLLGISSGVSIQYIIDFLYRIIKKIHFSKIPLYFFFLILTVLVFVTGMLVVPDETLKARQREQAINTFSPAINQALMSILDEEEESFKIITNYPVANLPGMSDKYVNVLFNSHDDYTLTLQSMEETNLYLLIPKYSDQAIMNEISEKISKGDYLLLLDDESWIPYLFIKIIKK